MAPDRADLLAEIAARRAPLDPARNTLAVGSAIRRMGIKGGNLPLIPEASWRPVVVMGQLNNLTSEPFEGRGMVGFSTGIGPAGVAPLVQFDSVGGGGVVVEFIRYEVSQVAPPGNLLEMWIAPPIFVPGGGATLRRQQNLGGIPTRSRTLTIHVPPVLNPQRILLQAGVAGTSSLLNLRAHIPPGSSLFFQTQFDLTNLEMEILWRELEDAPGAP